MPLIPESVFKAIKGLNLMFEANDLHGKLIIDVGLNGKVKSVELIQTESCIKQTLRELKVKHKDARRITMHRSDDGKIKQADFSYFYRY